MERREEFKRWLQNERHNKSEKHIPERIIDSYLKSVHKVSDAMYELGVISKRLYSMKSVEEVQAAVNQIRKDRTYLTMNTESGNMHHKALNHYINFTEMKANQ